MKKLASMLFAFLVIACSNQKNSSTELNEKDIVNELKMLEDSHFNAVESKDIDAILGFYSDDCITLSPEGPILYGKDWISTTLKSMFENYEFHESFEFKDIRVAGHRVIASFSYNQNLVSLKDGTSTDITGNGICVLKKAENGNWQFEWNAYNTSQ